MFEKITDINLLTQGSAHFSFTNCYVEVFKDEDIFDNIKIKRIRSDHSCKFFILELRAFNYTDISITHTDIKNLCLKKAPHNTNDVYANISFINTTIANIDIAEKIKFHSSIFFRQCTFTRENLYENLTSKCNFKNLEFHSSTIFEKCVFNICPNFLDTTFSRDTLFTGCIFNDVSSQKSEQSYRYLKNRMIDLSYDTMAHEFHALELEVRHNNFTYNGTRAIPIKKWFTTEDGLEIIGLYILKHISHFGRNLWRPLVILFCIFVIGADT